MHHFLSLLPLCMTSGMLGRQKFRKQSPPPPPQHLISYEKHGGITDAHVYFLLEMLISSPSDEKYICSLFDKCDFLV